MVVVMILMMSFTRGWRARRPGCGEPCMPRATCAAMQGSQSRVVHMGGGGGAAKGFGLVGLGKAADLGAGSGWGPSCFQVCGGVQRGGGTELDGASAPACACFVHVLRAIDQCSWW